MVRPTELNADSADKAIEELMTEEGRPVRPVQFRLLTMFWWTTAAGVLCAIWLVARTVPAEVYGVAFMVLPAVACVITTLRIR